MQNITSDSNKKIKQLRYLQKKKKRDKYGLFVVENLRTIYDALKSGIECKSLFIVEEMLKNSNERVKYIIDNVEKCYVINDKINKSFSSLSTSSGICAVYEIIEDKIDLDNIVVYLNAVSDPGNLGTIIRAAVAFGIKSIVVDEKCVDVYNQKTINASKDAIFKINIMHDKDCSVLDNIKNKMKVYATEINTENDIEVLKNNNVKCIVFGNEANGIDNKVKKRVDEFVSIKINKNMESLNVAITTAIVFYVIS